MRRQDDGNSLMINFVQKVNYVVTRSDIESRCGLVEQDQFGIAQQSSSDERRLLLSAGEFPNVAMAQAGEIQSFHNFS